MLLKGAAFERVRDRHLRYARALVDDHVTFRDDVVATDPRVLALIRSEVRGSAQFDPRDPTATITALSVEDDVIGACVVGVHLLSGAPEPWVYVWQVAVDPGWRMRGIGTVLLTMLPQVVAGSAPDLPRLQGTYGACAPADARFYQRAGFDVLQPGLPLSLLIAGTKPVVVHSRADHSCWMVRRW